MRVLYLYFDVGDLAFDGGEIDLQFVTLFEFLIGLMHDFFEFIPSQVNRVNVRLEGFVRLQKLQRSIE